MAKRTGGVESTGWAQQSLLVASDYSKDAPRAMDRFFKADHAVLFLPTVKETLNEQTATKLA